MSGRPAPGQDTEIQNWVSMFEKLRGVSGRGTNTAEPTKNEYQEKGGLRDQRSGEKEKEREATEAREMLWG